MKYINGIRLAARFSGAVLESNLLREFHVLAGRCWQFGTSLAGWRWARAFSCDVDPGGKRFWRASGSMSQLYPAERRERFLCRCRVSNLYFVIGTETLLVAGILSGHLWVERSKTNDGNWERQRMSIKDQIRDLRNALRSKASLQAHALRRHASI